MGLENPLHIAIILVVLLLLFGAKRLPEMGKGLGQGIRGFKDGLTSSGSPEESKPEPAKTITPAPTSPASGNVESATKDAEPLNAA